MKKPAHDQIVAPDAKDQQIKILESALLAISRKYETLSKATNDAIWDWDIQADSMEWNHGMYTIYGHHDKTIQRTEWINNIHVEDRQDVLDRLDKAFHEHKLNWSAIYRYKCANGIYKYTYDRAYIVYNNTTPIRVIGAMQDIDERMLALHEIEKLSLVASKTENLVIITDANENIEWVNEGFVRRTGYTLQEVLGKTPRILQGPGTSRPVLDKIKASIARGESCTEEVLNYTKHGDKFWIKLNINPVFNEFNVLHKFVAVETDVTVHKEYESKITSIALELSSLIENANAVIIGVDENGLVNEWNKVATVVTGYAKHELIGKKLTDFVSGTARQKIVDRHIQHLLRGNTIDLRQFEIQNRNGERNIFLLSATPRFNTNGKIVGLIAVGQDITELTEYRQSLEKKVTERTKELNNLLEKEKELASLKSQFASTVSHEFRTPLATISISANHILKYRNRMTSPEVDAKLAVVLKQVEHMTHLLEDVLTISRTQAPKIKIIRKSVLLVEFFETLKGEVERMNNETHEINLKFSIFQNEIFTDPNLLRNIFVNLFSNAIKFSPDKTVVQVHVTQNKKEWSVSVQDSGIGIPEDEVKKIFEPFHRASNASVIQGTGLGLSIVKKVVNLLGGEIQVKSHEGKGSIFCVTLPNTQ